MANILFPGIQTDELNLNASVAISEESNIIQVTLDETGDGTSFRNSDAEKLGRALKMQELTSERNRTVVREVEKPGKAVVVEEHDSEEA